MNTIQNPVVPNNSLSFFSGQRGPQHGSKIQTRTGGSDPHRFHYDKSTISHRALRLTTEASASHLILERGVCTGSAVARPPRCLCSRACRTVTPTLMPHCHAQSAAQSRTPHRAGPQILCEQPEDTATAPRSSLHAAGGAAGDSTEVSGPTDDLDSENRHRRWRGRGQAWKGCFKGPACACRAKDSDAGTASPVSALISAHISAQIAPTLPLWRSRSALAEASSLHGHDWPSRRGPGALGMAALVPAGRFRSAGPPGMARDPAWRRLRQGRTRSASQSPVTPHPLRRSQPAG
jgi:hypothetical protein